MEFLVLDSEHTEIDTVYGYNGDTVEEVKRSLVEHDGYDPSIIVINTNACADLEHISLDVILNTEPLYLAAIDAGYINKDTLEVQY